MTKPRARDLGLDFPGEPGPKNAFTDLPGVLVGHTTLIDGSKEGYGVGPICITNTHSMGMVHHAATRWLLDSYEEAFRQEHLWAMPVVAETYNGFLEQVTIAPAISAASAVVLRRHLVIRSFRAFRVERVDRPTYLLEGEQAVVAAGNTDSVARNLVFSDGSESCTVMDSRFQDQIALGGRLYTDAAETAEVIGFGVP